MVDKDTQSFTICREKKKILYTHKNTSLFCMIHILTISLNNKNKKKTKKKQGK